jgi:DNA-binding transcriptional MerR regulator
MARDREKVERSGAKGNRDEVIKAFGVTIKALRLYEELGMVVPPRNAGGKRVYGDAELVRLQAILALKRTGMTVARIAAFLKSKPDDLDALLAEHQQAMEARLREASLALHLIESARHGLKRGAPQTPESVGSIIGDSKSVLVFGAPEAYGLVSKLFTQDQIDVLFARTAEYRPRPSTSEDLVRERADLTAQIAKVHADARRLAEKGDPASPEALDMARRMNELTTRLSGGDKDLEARGYRFWEEGFKDPKIAATLPLTKKQWDFVTAARAELERREG